MRSRRNTKLLLDSISVNPSIIHLIKVKIILTFQVMLQLLLKEEGLESSLSLPAKHQVIKLWPPDVKEGLLLKMKVVHQLKARLHRIKWVVIPQWDLSLISSDLQKEQGAEIRVTQLLLKSLKKKVKCMKIVTRWVLILRKVIMEVKLKRMIWALRMLKTLFMFTTVWQLKVNLRLKKILILTLSLVRSFN